MALSNLESMYTLMFTAPVKASLMAEKNYRKIWSNHLKNLKEQLTDAEDGNKKDLIDLALNMAPVMSFEAHIETEMTMKIATIEKSSGEVGIQVGPFGFSGRYGKEKTQESTLSASAIYDLKNFNTVSLKEYLKNHNVDLENEPDVEKVQEAIKKLSDNKNSTINDSNDG